MGEDWSEVRGDRLTETLLLVALWLVFFMKLVHFYIPKFDHPAMYDKGWGTYETVLLKRKENLKRRK